MKRDGCLGILIVRVTGHHVDVERQGGRLVVVEVLAGSVGGEFVHTLGAGEDDRRAHGRHVHARLVAVQGHLSRQPAHVRFNLHGHLHRDVGADLERVVVIEPQPGAVGAGLGDLGHAGIQRDGAGGRAGGSDAEVGDRLAQPGHVHRRQVEDGVVQQCGHVAGPVSILMQQLVEGDHVLVGSNVKITVIPVRDCLGARSQAGVLVAPVVRHSGHTVHDRVPGVVDAQFAIAPQVHRRWREGTVALGHVAAAKAPLVVTLHVEPLDDLAAGVNVVGQGVTRGFLAKAPQVVVAENDDAVGQQVTHIRDSSRWIPDCDIEVWVGLEHRLQSTYVGVR